MRAATHRSFAAAWSAVLTAGAVLGAVCLLGTVIAPLAGVRPLIFLSGSMSPTIPTGSLALSRVVDASEIQVNDIVTVPSNGTYLTHRVVDVTHAPGKATLLLRGDGNKAVDATLYEVTSAPKVRFWVPYAGTVVAWFSHAPGIYVLAGWVAIVIGTLRRHRNQSSPMTPPTAGRRRPKLFLTTQRLLSHGRCKPSIRAARPA